MTRATVIMASYNAANTLESAATSVLAQTMHDLELIIVDDASKDATLDVAQKLAAQDSRVVVVAQPVNGGPAAARNAALAVAKGEWICIVDADDVILPGRLKSMLAAGQAQHADIVFDNLLYIEGLAEHPYLPAHLNLAGPLSLATYIESHRRSCPIPNMGFLKPLIRRSVMQNLGGCYDESLKIGEDAMLIMALMAGGAKAWLVDGAWYRYFRHEGSISAKQGPDSVQMINAAFRQFLKARIIAQPAREAMQRLITDNERRIHASALADNVLQGHIIATLREIVKTPVIVRFLLNELRSQARHMLKNGLTRTTV
jgi:succinoglycan biosynthesis protein ExoO